MKTLILQTIDSKTIQMIGFGTNRKLEALTVDKLPGSILIKSDKYSSSIRIYCIYDDFENTWVFAFANTKEAKHTNPLDYTMSQSWDKKNKSRIEVDFPDDATLELEGEFADDL